jgi:hypothetical protein
MVVYPMIWHPLIFYPMIWHPAVNLSLYQAFYSKDFHTIEAGSALTLFYSGMPVFRAKSRAAVSRNSGFLLLSFKRAVRI